MDYAALGSLAVAALDLALVQDIIGAMRAADAGAAASNASPLTPLPTLQSARHIHPATIYEPGKVIHADPVYARPKVIRPEPRIEPAEPGRLALQPTSDNPAKKVHHAASPVQPPWAVLVWQMPTPPRPIIKVVEYRTDINSKGTLIDTFI